MIFAFYHTKIKMSTPFLRHIPWNFAHVLNVPLPRNYKEKKTLEMWEPLRPKYPKNYKNPKYLSKKKNFCKTLGRGTLNTCAIFQGHLSESGVDTAL